MYGVYEHMGAYKSRGHPDTPKYKNMPATKKSWKKTYLKLTCYI